MEREKLQVFHLRDRNNKYSMKYSTIYYKTNVTIIILLSKLKLFNYVLDSYQRRNANLKEETNSEFGK